MNLSELQAKAAAMSPQSLGSVPVLQGRTLHLDGDGLAYYCAGKDDTLLGVARENVANKIRQMRESAGAEQASVLLTASGSHKGYRYAVARVKAYQGQRSASRRPVNWAGLRDLLSDGFFGDRTRSTSTAEADDLFGYYGHSDPEHTVIATQDKDMRMVPGWHMDWVSNLLFYLPPGTFDASFNDKQFGLKWFWLQMLHGDTADGVPGLPWYADSKGKLKKCGEVTAAAMLAGTSSNDEALAVVHEAYRSYYAGRALVEMLEQAVLLWMRRDEHSLWDDCLQPGGPLYPCRLWHDDDAFFKAYTEIKDRITTVENYVVCND